MHTHPTSGSGMGHGLALSRERAERFDLGDLLILAAPVAMILLAVWWPR